MDSHKDFVVLWNRFFHLSDFHDIRGSVPSAHSGPHEHHPRFERQAHRYKLIKSPRNRDGEGNRTPINPERLSRLQKLGLNEQQARAYLALLDHPMATVNELARASRVPRPKLYEVLEGLNKRGLVEIVPETPQRFRAASISAFFEHRVAELKTEEQELKRLVGEISLYLAQAPRAAGAEGDAAFIHTVHGRTHFAVNLRRMVQESQHSLDVVGDRLLLARLRMHEEILRSIAVASKRIAVRVLAPENAVDQVEGRRIHMDEIAEVLRRAPFPLGDAFLVVRDEQESMVVRFMPNDLHPSRGNDRVVVSRDPEFAALWHRLANQAWDAGVAWPGARAR